MEAEKIMKIIGKTLGVIILIFILMYILMFGMPKPFPVHIDKVTKIELLEFTGGTQPYKIFEITDETQVKEFLGYFKKVSFGRKASPACPFGLPIIFYEKNKKTQMELGTDSCGLIKYNDYYYFLNLSIDKIEEMQDKIRQLGLDFDRIRI
jgi:hypothetical protein